GRRRYHRPRSSPAGARAHAGPDAGSWISLTWSRIDDVDQRVGDDIDTELRSRSRILGLDLLRAVAASLVLLSRVAFLAGASRPGAVGGWSAGGELRAALFVALSAFLLSTPFGRRGRGEDTAWSAATYLLRRAARIPPASLLALGGVVLAAVLLG